MCAPPTIFVLQIPSAGGTVKNRFTPQAWPLNQTVLTSPRQWCRLS